MQPDNEHLLEDHKRIFIFDDVNYDYCFCVNVGKRNFIKVFSPETDPREINDILSKVYAEFQRQNLEGILKKYQIIEILNLRDF